MGRQRTVRPASARDSFATFLQTRRMKPEPSQLEAAGRQPCRSDQSRGRGVPIISDERWRVRRDSLVGLGIGILAGLVATEVTDRAQHVLWKATPASEKVREPSLEESSAGSAAVRLCQALGVEPNDRELGILKNLVHYGLGAGWGSLYGLMRRYSGMSPLGAGIATGSSLSLIIDEALNPALGITPPSSAYPASSHLRGYLTHLIYGLTIAVTAEALHRATMSLIPRAGRS